MGCCSLRDFKGGIGVVVLASGAMDALAVDEPFLATTEETPIGFTLRCLEEAGLRRVEIVVDRQGRRMELSRDPSDRGTIFALTGGEAARGGIALLSPLLDGCLVLPAELPLLRPGTIDRVLRAAFETAAPVVYPTFQGDRGFPVYLDRTLFAEIVDEPAPEALAAVLARHEGEAREIAVFDHGCVEAAGVEMTDWTEKLASHHAPDDAECEAMMAVVAMDEPVCRHCQAVAELATWLAEQLNEKGHGLDVGLVRSAALVHDIGKGHSHHAEVGSGMLRVFGFPKVADLVADHHLGAAFDGKTIDERAVLFLAEKLVQGERRVSLAERFAPAFTRFGSDPEAVREISARLATAETMLHAVESEIDMTPFEPLSIRAPEGAVMGDF
ncbi:HD domain-containing protein [Consotaella salsifontis]|uniref:HDIG domain-containing protein n=1 Tax=Consotaella salsifontis TaxID=1365950 RepID=A0A1T4LGD1_9HYPH|nr:HD domain-containing protein [Consotaella salsifontis]SJZ53710.1 HDIG domain-containing protein [Consotaella salsifontis]